MILTSFTQFLNEYIVSVSHVLQQNIPVFESFRTHLTRKRRTLSAVKSKVSSKRFLLKISLLTSRAAISYPIVENFEVTVLLESSSIENEICNIFITFWDIYHRFSKHGTLTKKNCITGLLQAGRHEKQLNVSGILDHELLTNKACQKNWKNW